MWARSSSGRSCTSWARCSTTNSGQRAKTCSGRKARSSSSAFGTRRLLLLWRRRLGPQIAAGERELRGVPERAIGEARLRRDVDLATSLFTSVQQRYDEARLAEASSVADVRILDAAVAPQDPLKEKASRLVVLGFVAGRGLGPGGAVVADRVDPRMRYPDQVTRQMGLPILGVLPHVKKRSAGPDDEEVAQVIEAMRSVRLSLTQFYGGNGPGIGTVTSPGAGDGKSFVPE